MVFPNSDPFKQFFSSITKHVDANEKHLFEEIIVREEYAAKDHKSRNVLFPKKAFFIRKNNTIKLGSVLKKISKYLEMEGHATNDKICETILYCYTFLPTSDNPIEQINQLLSWISTSDLNQLLVFQGTNPDNFELVLGSYRLGTVESSKIERYCRRFRIDYYELYGDQLKGRLALSRQHRTIKSLDFQNY